MQRTCQQEQLVGKNKDEVSILFGDPDQIHDLKDGSLWTYDVSTLLWRELDIGLTPFNIPPRQISETTFWDLENWRLR